MRKLLTTVFMVALAMFSASPSFAHVEIIDSFPTQFSNVNPIPTQVWIEFNGELQTLEGEAVNSLEVVDSTSIAVSFGDAVIEGGKITSVVSGQSAPGVFTVKYRVVGDDGHVIEGEYTFNASPDYSDAQTPMVIDTAPEESSVPVGGVLLAVLFAIFFAGIFKRAKNRRE